MSEARAPARARFVSDSTRASTGFMVGLPPHTPEMPLYYNASTLRTRLQRRYSCN